MVDLKRLITVFLIVSALTSSSVFLISSIADRGTPRSSPESAKEAESPQIAAGSNVFVEDIPEKSREGEGKELAFLQEQGLPPLPLSDNLTQNFANTLAREIVQANPGGPLSLEDGSGILTSLDDEAIAGSVDRALTAGPVVELIDSLPLGAFATEPDSEAGSVRYSEAVDSVITKTILSPEYQKLLSLDPTPEAIAAANVVLDQAIRGLKSETAPESFVQLHERFLVLLINQKSFVEIVNNHEADPLRALLVAESAPQLIDTVLEYDYKMLNNEFQKLAGQKFSLENKKEAGWFLGGLTGLFGVSRTFAAAFVPVGDILNKPEHLITAKSSTGNWLHRIFEWVRKTATEILKDQVVHMMVQQIIGWVQGGGKPQFITNWRGFLRDAGNEAAGNLIAKYRPGFCSSFGPLLEVALQPVPNIELRRSACTLDRVVGNVRGFYDNFRSGGWIAYGAAFQSNNNLYGSLIGYHDKIMREGAEAKEAASKEAEAGKGFTGVKICRSTEIDRGTGATSTVTERPGKGGLCFDGTEPIITSPGEAAAGLLDTALGAPLHRIVNAQDFTALVSALVNSALNRLIKAGTSGITGMFNSSRSTTDASGLAGTCAGLIGQAFTDCQNSASGVIKTINSAPSSTPTSTLPGDLPPSPPAPTSTTATSTAPCAGLTGFARIICLNRRTP